MSETQYSKLKAVYFLLPPSIYAMRKVRIGTILELSCATRNSHFVAQCRNSYLAQYNSRIAPAHSENRDKVGISFYFFYLLYKVRIWTKLEYII